MLIALIQIMASVLKRNNVMVNFRHFHGTMSRSFYCRKAFLHKKVYYIMMYVHTCKRI